MSLSSMIFTQLSDQDIQKLGEWISKDQKEEILTSIKRSWKTRMYAIFLLRLHNFEGKQWRLFSFKSKQRKENLVDLLNARALNVTEILKKHVPALNEEIWYLLGTSSLKEGLESYNLISWQGKWEGFIMRNPPLLLCDKVADGIIESHQEKFNENGMQIERKALSSGKIEKIGNSLVTSDQKLHWRRLWVGKGVFNAGVKTVTFEGEKHESLEESARKLAGKADGFTPGCEQDGSTIGWKVGDNSLILRGELGDFKAEITAKDPKTLFAILNEIPT